MLRSNLSQYQNETPIITPEVAPTGISDGQKSISNNTENQDEPSNQITKIYELPQYFIVETKFIEGSELHSNSLTSKQSLIKDSFDSEEDVVVVSDDKNSLNSGLHQHNLTTANIVPTIKTTTTTNTKSNFSSITTTQQSKNQNLTIPCQTQIFIAPPNNIPVIKNVSSLMNNQTSLIQNNTSTQTQSSVLSHMEQINTNSSVRTTIPKAVSLSKNVNSPVPVALLKDLNSSTSMSLSSKQIAVQPKVRQFREILPAPPTTTSNISLLSKHNVTPLQDPQTKYTTSSKKFNMPLHMSIQSPVRQTTKNLPVPATATSKHSEVPTSKKSSTIPKIKCITPVQTPQVRPTYTIIQSSNNSSLKHSNVRIWNPSNLQIKRVKISDAIATSKNRNANVSIVISQNIEKNTLTSNQQNNKTKNLKSRKPSNVNIENSSNFSRNLAVDRNENKKFNQPCYIIQNGNNTESVTIFTNGNLKNCGTQTPNRKVHVGISTIAPLPTRSRSIQIKPITNDKSVQCELIKSDYDYLNFLNTNDDDVIIINGSNNNMAIKLYSNGKCECLKCGEICKNLISMKRHFKIHQQKLILCRKCGKTFTNEFKLREHENLEEGIISFSNNKSIKSMKNIKTKFIYCPYPLCGHVNRSLLEMYDHINYHSRQKLHICSCGKNFITYEKYKIHQNVKKCHQKFYKFPYKLMKNEKFYNKLICKVYPLQNKSAIYKNRLIRKYKHLCRYCYKICKNSFELLNHVRKMHLKNFRCLLCNEILCVKSYNAHIIEHKKPFFIIQTPTFVDNDDIKVRHEAVITREEDVTVERLEWSDLQMTEIDEGKEEDDEELLTPIIPRIQRHDKAISLKSTIQMKCVRVKLKDCMKKRKEFTLKPNVYSAKRYIERVLKSENIKKRRKITSSSSEEEENENSRKSRKRSRTASSRRSRTSSHKRRRRSQLSPQFILPNFKVDEHLIIEPEIDAYEIKERIAHDDGIDSDSDSEERNDYVYDHFLHVLYEPVNENQEQTIGLPETFQNDEAVDENQKQTIESLETSKNKKCGFTIPNEVQIYSTEGQLSENVRSTEKQKIVESEKIRINYADIESAVNEEFSCSEIQNELKNEDAKSTEEQKEMDVEINTEITADEINMSPLREKAVMSNRIEDGSEDVETNFSIKENLNEIAFSSKQIESVGEQTTELDENEMFTTDQEIQQEELKNESNENEQEINLKGNENNVNETTELRKINTTDNS